MKKTRLVFTSIVMLAAVAVPLQAQTLGEAARLEAERRARLKEATKVFTNADLDALPSRGGATPVAPARPDAVLAPAGAEAAGAAPKATPADEAEAPVQPTVREKRDEEHWRERAQVIRDRLNRLQSDAVALEGRVDGLRAEIDAAPASQKAMLTGDLQQTSAALTRVQVELGLIQDEWRKFEDRAVQAKIPPDWIR